MKLKKLIPIAAALWAASARRLLPVVAAWRAAKPKRFLPAAAALGALLLIDAVLRMTGAGVPPSKYCPDGSPRGVHRYEARNLYLETPLDDVTRYVVCFGDSWTFGLGVERAEAWPAQLEALLRRHDPDARVVNAAPTRAMAADVARLFRREVVRYRARQAVVMIGAQDAVPKGLYDKRPLGDPFRPQKCSRPAWRLGHLLSRRLLTYRLWVSPPDPGDDPRVEREQSITQTQMALLNVAQAARETGVALVFVNYPKLHLRRAGRPYLPLESRDNFLIDTAAASLGDQLVDLEKRWGDKTADYLLPWMLWPHPNVAGHLDIARAVAERL